MKIAHFVLLTGLLCSGCASARVDSSTMPPGEFQSTDTDEAALYEAGLALSGLGISPTTPQTYAKVYADVEYLAGAYNTHARWLGIDGSAQEQIIIARNEVRDYVGISQQARSQDVLNALLLVSNSPDGEPIQKALSNPIFTLGPQVTLQRLVAKPDFFTTPAALAHLNRAKSEPYGGCSRIFC